MIAASVTVRTIGPAVSWLWAMGTIPAWATSPTVGLRPTIALLPAGQTIDPSVSVPTAIAHRFAAAATADPELEPQGSHARSYGLRVKPPRALQPLRKRPASVTGLGTRPRKLAHSDRLVLPSTTAPAARSRVTIAASRGTRLPTSASEPAVVSIASLVAMLSLSRTGIPCNGPRLRPARRSASRRAAISRASGLVSMTACRRGSRRPMRSRYASVSSTLLSAPDAISASSSGTEASNHGAPSSASVPGVIRSSIGPW